ncbi:hypothetical protein WAL18_10340 [Waltera acetigignens]|nr:MAG TPA: hypothetical protein [Caudoviricetes sp.]
MIGEKTYPFKIDLNVLEIVQEKYGSVKAFERELLGWRYRKDEEGIQMYTTDGIPLIDIVEPSVAAVKMILPAAVMEGMQIEADEHNRPMEDITEDYIIHNCNVAYMELCVMLQEEFGRCFSAKK